MKEKYNVRIETIPSGDEGIRQTVERIRELVKKGARSWEVIALAREVVRDTPPKDKRAEIFAIWRFIKSGEFKFRHDPHGVELLQDARITLGISNDFGQLNGDCDDLTTAILSLGKALGINGRAITIAADHKRPNDYTHIYPELYDAVNEEWIPVDATPQRFDTQFGWYPQNYTRKKVWYVDRKESDDIADISDVFETEDDLFRYMELMTEYKKEEAIKKAEIDRQDKEERKAEEAALKGASKAAKKKKKALAKKQPWYIKVLKYVEPIGVKARDDAAVRKQTLKDLKENKKKQEALLEKTKKTTKEYEKMAQDIRDKKALIEKYEKLNLEEEKKAMIMANQGSIDSKNAGKKKIVIIGTLSILSIILLCGLRK